MEVYFTLDNYRRRFSVIINNLNISIFRIENRELIWEGNVLNIFIGKSHLNDMTEFSGARDDSIWDGNSILLELEAIEDEVSINQQANEEQPQKSVSTSTYIIIGNRGVYSFQTEDKIFKFTSNVGNNQVPYAVAYGERNIYYLSDRYQFIPYDSIHDDDIRKKIPEMNVSYEPYRFLYDTNDGERNKIYSLNLIAPRCLDMEIENYFEVLSSTNNID